jgi:hypothetical protein
MRQHTADNRQPSEDTANLRGCGEVKDGGRNSEEACRKRRVMERISYGHSYQSTSG